MSHDENVHIRNTTQQDSYKLTVEFKTNKIEGYSLSLPDHATIEQAIKIAEILSPNKQIILDE